MVETINPHGWVCQQIIVIDHWDVLNRFVDEHRQKCCGAEMFLSAWDASHFKMCKSYHCWDTMHLLFN